MIIFVAKTVVSKPKAKKGGEKKSKTGGKKKVSTTKAPKSPAEQAVKKKTPTPPPPPKVCTCHCVNNGIISLNKRNCHRMKLRVPDFSACGLSVFTYQLKLESIDETQLQTCSLSLG